ncbi:MAG TPA: DUF5671 domain-containing protein [Candidatus Paceibacterota bacterium]|nr:DUF5671 domain-containing protein [Candidatus Paceibacterota bacterium]
METTPAAAGTSKTTPKDFFLWAGAMIALYLAVISFITLLFEYINYVYPDPNAGYGDPYSSGLRFAMAALIVLVPATLVLLRLIRGTILVDAGKANLWVRRWALMLTIFVMTATILIDLITLVNYFLNGEITTRFALKVIVVLLTAGFVFMHFLADLKGHWIANPKRANLVGAVAAVVAFSAIIAGFFIVGTPAQARDVRLDIQRVNDLQGIQSQVVTFYQQKQSLPSSLSELADPLSYYTLPKDPETGTDYEYERTGNLSFKLCADFAREGKDLQGRGGFGRDIAVSYPYPGDLSNENWQHEEGYTCFDRTIDPERYPPFEKPILR